MLELPSNIALCCFVLKDIFTSCHFEFTPHDHKGSATACSGFEPATIRSKDEHRNHIPLWCRDFSSITTTWFAHQFRHILHSGEALNNLRYRGHLCNQLPTVAKGLRKQLAMPGLVLECWRRVLHPVNLNDYNNTMMHRKNIWGT